MVPVVNEVAAAPPGVADAIALETVNAIVGIETRIAIMAMLASTANTSFREVNVDKLFLAASTAVPL